MGKRRLWYESLASCRLRGSDTDGLNYHPSNHTRARVHNWHTNLTSNQLTSRASPSGGTYASHPSGGRVTGAVASFSGLVGSLSANRRRWFACVNLYKSTSLVGPTPEKAPVVRVQGTAIFDPRLRQDLLAGRPLVASNSVTCSCKSGCAAGGLFVYTTPRTPLYF